jgi:glycosyltransferase involved in cell wall biosynthesis
VKKILIVADQPGWVFEKHALEIKKRVTGYKIDIAFHRQDIGAISTQYDLIYVMDPMPMRYGPKEKTILGLRNQFLYEQHPLGVKGLYESGLNGRCVDIKSKCCILHVVNKSQYVEFSKINIEQDLLLVPHGIDSNIFDMKKYDKIQNASIVVGVCGRDSSNKGFSHVKNACKKAGFEFVSAQYGQKQLAKDQMPMFYSGIDIYVNFSQSEGLNNPILEAGAMGVPIIATKTGAAPEIIKQNENGLLIDRTEEALLEALLKLGHKSKRMEYSNNIYEEIMRNWTWDKCSIGFNEMFDLYFEKKGK